MFSRGKHMCYMYMLLMIIYIWSLYKNMMKNLTDVSFIAGPMWWSGPNFIKPVSKNNATCKFSKTNFVVYMYVFLCSVFSFTAPWTPSKVDDMCALQVFIIIYYYYEVQKNLAKQKQVTSQTSINFALLPLVSH